MAYATPANLIARFDARTLGDLAADDGTQVSQNALLSHANVEAALDDASGEIEAALLQGKRYSVADLEGLTGNSAKYLIRITCEIAFWLLWERRTWTDSDQYDNAKDRARKALDRLRKGEHVFNVEAVKDAGLPVATGPTRVELNDLNLMRDMAEPFYPRRRLPRGR